MPRMIFPFQSRALLAAGALSVVLLPVRPLAAQNPVEEPPAFQTPSNQGVAVEAPTPKRGPTPAPGTEKRTADSAVTPNDRNPPRHQVFLERTKVGKLDLLFLGDSITDRMPKVGEWTWLRYAPYNPANFGVDGERTEDVLWRIQNGELDGIHPKVAVVMIGTNNFGNKTELPEWAAAGVKKIVDTIHEKLPATRVLVLGIFPRSGPDDPVRPKIEAANAILAKLDDGKATRYLDIGKKFLDDKGNIAPEVMRDKLHPTARGYEIWWEAMRPLLDEMMAAPALAGSPSPTPAPTPTPKATPTSTPAKGAKPK